MSSCLMSNGMCYSVSYLYTVVQYLACVIPAVDHVRAGLLILSYLIWFVGGDTKISLREN